jgi:hypothetical protein
VSALSRLLPRLCATNVPSAPAPGISAQFAAEPFARFEERIVPSR